MRGDRGRLRAEVRTNEYDFVVGMAGGESLEPADHALGIVFRCDARFGSRKIEAVKLLCAEPHVHVVVRESGDDGSSLQINNFGLGGLSAQDFLVRADRIDASAGDGERLRPLSFGIASIDVAVN